MDISILHFFGFLGKKLQNHIYKNVGQEFHWLKNDDLFYNKSYKSFLVTQWHKSSTKIYVNDQLQKHYIYVIYAKIKSKKKWQKRHNFCYLGVLIVSFKYICHLNVHCVK